MKKIYLAMLIALVGFAFNGCAPKEEVDGALQGYWQNDLTQEGVHFLSEAGYQTGYQYGYEWDDKNDLTEQDRLDQRNKDGFPGNGWFAYKLETITDSKKTTKQLTWINFMKNGGAEIPKIYIVTKLTNTKLEFYTKDDKSDTYSFTRK